MDKTDQIVLDKVTKAIKGRTVLDQVTLVLDRGGIYGFHGVNGSGKTMLFRAVSGLIKLDGGSVAVFGEHLGKDASFPKSLGIVIESVGLWDEYTGMENLRMLASIKHQAGEEDIRRAIRRVGLDPEDRRTYKKYSLGMKQRLGIAQAIMEKPELLILDEPTNALDEHGQKLVHDLIVEEKRRGATILVASHDRAQLDSLCDRQFKMYEGKLTEG